MDLKICNFYVFLDFGGKFPCSFGITFGRKKREKTSVTRQISQPPNQGGCLSLCGETLVDPRLGVDFFGWFRVVKIDKP